MEQASCLLLIVFLGKVSFIWALQEGSYKASTYNLELETEIQRLKAQVILSWEKEARTLNWFGLTDGMNVLEASSGPRFFTEKLL